MGEAAEPSAVLVEFYDFLYGEREGYVCAATKTHDERRGDAWKEYFFLWPNQRDDLVTFTLLNRSQSDVYVAPALFSERKAKREFVIGADVVWVELDEAPANTDNVPDPTCRVGSGGDGHEHWYWKLSTVLNGAQLDILNKALTYHMDADVSGWDCTQVLRPPNTFNFKRKRETSLVYKSSAVLDVALFDSIPAPPAQVSVEIPDSIPPVEMVVAKYTWPKVARELYFATRPPDRSNALMSLGYYCAEMGMSNPEILSIILNADERWGKFRGRDDRMRRLGEIVSLARAKYPFQNSAQSVSLVEDMAPDFKPMGFLTLLATEVNLEWQWEEFLQAGGFFLLTGPPGVGKTQFCLDAAGRMATGQPFLDKPMKPSKVGFFSLEMGLTDLKFFAQQLQYSFDISEHQQLEENLLLFPFGEPLNMSDQSVRSWLDQIVGDYKLDGIFIDSLGSATPENLLNDEIRTFFDWMDSFRQRHSAFTWLIHHHRKSNNENRKPKRMDDIYGNGVISRRATTIACLWETALQNTLEYIPLKMRMMPRKAPFYITRDARLHFVKSSDSLVGAQPVGSPLLAADGQQATSGPGKRGRASSDHQAAVTGSWSSGPGVGPANSATVTEKSADGDRSDFTINLNMGGPK